MNPHSERPLRTRPMFENMPQLSDEGVWDLLELLVGLLDAYESHYAVELQRLRARRYQEVMREHERSQLPLPLGEFDDEPF